MIRVEIKRHQPILDHAGYTEIIFIPETKAEEADLEAVRNMAQDSHYYIDAGQPIGFRDGNPQNFVKENIMLTKGLVISIRLNLD